MRRIARVDSERKAAQEALKMSSLSDAKIYLGGVAATYKDMADGARYDLMIAVVSALTLIFMIMLLLTRSVVAALVLVGTGGPSARRPRQAEAAARCRRRGQHRPAGRAEVLS